MKSKTFRVDGWTYCKKCGERWIGIRKRCREPRCVIEHLEERLVSVTKELTHWQNMAAAFSSNSDYYMSIVEKIGELFGNKCKIADDGTLMPDIIHSKVPEIVLKELSIKKEINASTL